MLPTKLSLQIQRQVNGKKTEMCHAIPNQKKAGGITLPPHKVDFRGKKRILTWTEIHFLMVTVSIH